MQILTVSAIRLSDYSVAGKTETMQTTCVNVAMI